jgi:hypothetical protein
MRPEKGTFTALIVLTADEKAMVIHTIQSLGRVLQQKPTAHETDER